jgi:hypothetical protein
VIFLSCTAGRAPWRRSTQSPSFSAWPASPCRLARAFLQRDPSLAHLGLALVNANEFVTID